MPTIKGQILKYEPDEEHILRRLGGALVVLWNDLPETTREMFLAQATLIGDRHETVQLRQQIEAFIKNAKVIG